MTLLGRSSYCLLFIHFLLNAFTVMSCILSIQPNPYHMSTDKEEFLSAIIHPFLFHSAFQDKVDFIANAGLLQR